MPVHPPRDGRFSRGPGRTLPSRSLWANALWWPGHKAASDHSVHSGAEARRLLGFWLGCFLGSHGSSYAASASSCLPRVPEVQALSASGSGLQFAPPREGESVQTHLNVGPSRWTQRGVPLLGTDGRRLCGRQHPVGRLESVWYVGACSSRCRLRHRPPCPSLHCVRAAAQADMSPSGEQSPRVP